jgi:hypothetical protein
MEAPGMVNRGGTIGRAGRAVETRDDVSDSLEVAFGLASEKGLGGILPGPDNQFVDANVGGSG